MKRDDVMRWAAVLVALGALGGCRRDEEEGLLASDALGQDGTVPTSLGLAPLSREQLQDPRTCAGCHPVHFRQWQQSMHAYAADDPVFLAMNRRGQRDTNGALGDFCVRCHAPMAVRAGLTQDGLNLDQVPRKMKGVTCYFCHNAVDAGPDHFNNPLVLANDTTMRGGIRDPVNPGVHEVAYDARFNNHDARSAQMCGACHDIVNPKGTHIERTYEEYQRSFFNLALGGPGSDSCQGCHMPARNREGVQVASVGSVPLPKRDLHEHAWPGVDVALSDWPDDALFRRRTECELSKPSGLMVLQVTHEGRGKFVVTLETNAGHAMPSGASQDRRLWLEAIAYDAQDRVLLKTGVIADGELEEHPLDDPRHDRFMRGNLLRDRMVDEAGQETHDFWAASAVPIRNVIPPPADPKIPHVAELKFQLPVFVTPTRVEMRMRMRPVGMDVLDDLIASGDLDPAVAARVPTFTLWQSKLVWTPERGNVWRPPASRAPLDCDFKDEDGIAP